MSQYTWCNTKMHKCILSQKNSVHYLPLSFGVLQQRTYYCTMPHIAVSSKFPYVKQETNSFPIVLGKRIERRITRKRRFTRTCPGNTFLPRTRARTLVKFSTLQMQQRR